MKKKIIDTAKSRKIREDALKRMREAKDNIDPELLDKAREAIATGVQKEREARLDKHEPEGDVPVDRKKNLHTIIKFLDGLDGNSDFQKKIERDLKAFIQSQPENPH